MIFLYQTTINLNQIKPETELRYFDYIDIIYREERGADPERLFADFPRYKEKKDITPTAQEKKQEILLQKRINYLKSNFPDEYHIDKTKKLYQNKDLERDRDYTYEKQKIIIHHSAMPTNNIKTKKQMYKHLQEIYELHCFYRDRGDIGYHFFIDKRGNIYEGKAGGPGVVGAHAQFNNFNSIGIDLLGNLNNEQITNEQLKSLINLIIALIKKYNINIFEKTVYHEKIEYPPYIKDRYENPIGYHKLVSNTACPGKNVINKIGFIQKFIKTYLQNFPENENHTKNINKLRSGISYNFTEKELSNYFQNFQTTKKSTDGSINYPIKTQKSPQMVGEISQNEAVSFYSIILDKYKFQLLLPTNIVERKNQIKTIQTILNKLLTKNLNHDQRDNIIYNLNEFLEASYNYKNTPNKNTKNILRLQYHKLKLSFDF